MAFRWRVMRQQIGKKGQNEVREGASKTGRSMVAEKNKTRSIQMPLSLTRLEYTDDGLKLWANILRKRCSLYLIVCKVFR